MLQPAPPSVVQMHAAAESVTVNTQPPSTSCWPKLTIRLRLQADQAEISNNNCTNSDCNNLK